MVVHNVWTSKIISHNVIPYIFLQVPLLKVLGKSGNVSSRNRFACHVYLHCGSDMATNVKFVSSLSDFSSEKSIRVCELKSNVEVLKNAGICFELTSIL